MTSIPTWHDWSLEDFAAEYANTMRQPPNAWGQHVSPIFGQSHVIMHEASRRFGQQATQDAFAAACTSQTAQHANREK